MTADGPEFERFELRPSVTAPFFVFELLLSACGELLLILEGSSARGELVFDLEGPSVRGDFFLELPDDSARGDFLVLRMDEDCKLPAEADCGADRFKNRGEEIVRRGELLFDEELDRGEVPLGEESSSYTKQSLVAEMNTTDIKGNNNILVHFGVLGRVQQRFLPYGKCCVSFWLTKIFQSLFSTLMSLLLHFHPDE